MKRTVITFMLIVCAVLVGFAQTDAERNPIYTIKVKDLPYVDPDTKTSVGSVLGTVAEALVGSTTDKHHPEYASSVNAAIKSALGNVMRLVPTTADDADLVLDGNISNITTGTQTHTYDTKDSKGRVTHNMYTDNQAYITVFISIIDPQTGRTWDQKFSTGDTFFNNFSTESEAIKDNLAQLQSQITKYLNSQFPLYAFIIEQGDTKKDKQKDVYIDLGFDNRVYKGMRFIVNEVGERAGRTTEKKIGRLKVEEVLGNDISRCKVDKGAKEIKQALDDGKTVSIVSE